MTTKQQDLTILRNHVITGMDFPTIAKNFKSTRTYLNRRARNLAKRIAEDVVMHGSTRTLAYHGITEQELDAFIYYYYDRKRGDTHA